VILIGLETRIGSHADAHGSSAYAARATEAKMEIPHQLSRLLFGLALLSFPGLAVTVTDHMVTKAVSTSGCTVPAPVTAFLTTDHPCGCGSTSLARMPVTWPQRPGIRRTERHTIRQAGIRWHRPVPGVIGHPLTSPLSAGVFSRQLERSRLLERFHPVLAQLHDSRARRSVD